MLAAASSGTTVADLVAGIILLAVVIVEAIYVLRQSLNGDEDGDGGALVPANPIPKGPAPGTEAEAHETDDPEGP